MTHGPTYPRSRLPAATPIPSPAAVGTCLTRPLRRSARCSANRRSAICPLPGAPLRAPVLILLRSAGPTIAPIALQTCLRTDPRACDRTVPARSDRPGPSLPVSREVGRSPRTRTVPRTGRPCPARTGRPTDDRSPGSHHGVGSAVPSSCPAGSGLLIGTLRQTDSPTRPRPVCRRQPPDRIPVSWTSPCRAPGVDVYGNVPDRRPAISPAGQRRADPRNRKARPSEHPDSGPRNSVEHPGHRNSAALLAHRNSAAPLARRNSTAPPGRRSSTGSPGPPDSARPRVRRSPTLRPGTRPRTNRSGPGPDAHRAHRTTNRAPCTAGTGPAGTPGTAWAVAERRPAHPPTATAGSSPATTEASGPDSRRPTRRRACVRPRRPGGTGVHCATCAVGRC